MRTLYIMITASAIFLAGCVTMPEEVPETYLVEKTAEEGRTIDRLKTAIIAQNQEVRVMKDRVKDASTRLKIEKGRTALLKKERSLLEDKQKQYQFENDSAKMNENAKNMIDNDYQIRNQDARYEHADAILEMAEAEQELSEAELSAQVAELAFEKAKVAKTYLVKKQSTSVPDDKKGSTAKGPETYDEKYVKYLEKQRAVLADKKKAREEAAMRLKIVQDKLKSKDLGR